MFFTKQRKFSVSFGELKLQAPDYDPSGNAIGFSVNFLVQNLKMGDPRFGQYVYLQVPAFDTRSAAWHAANDVEYTIDPSTSNMVYYVPASVVGAPAVPGQLPNMSCTQINEPSDLYTWDDNFLCGTQDWGLQWSYAGPIPGMTCTLINEPSDPDTWGDNYLCSPVDYGFKWSYAGPIAGMTCLQINEPADPVTWQDNYPCAAP